ETATHVTPGKLYKGLGGFRSDFDTFGFNDVGYSLPNSRYGEGGEAEAGTAREKGGIKFMRVVCNDAEPGISGILFHNSSQSVLSSGSHCVCFVEDDELKGCKFRGGGGGGIAEDLTGGGKRFDLFADDLNAAIIRGIELEDLLAHVFGAEDFASKCKDGRRFAGTGRPVEE